MADQESPKTEYPTLNPIVRKSLESGLITVSAVSENRRPETSVMESVNMDFDTIGAARVRKGLTRLGAALTANACTGMHYFVDTVNISPNTRLIVVNSTVASYLNAGNTFTTIRSGLTSGSKARFSTYLNYVFMVNGTEATAIWDGQTSTSFVTTGNATSAPTGTLIENYRSRMWIGGNSTYPDRLYYSSIPSSVTTPIITWNTSVTTGQWIDISPSDGEKMTGLYRGRNALLVFKPNHIYRVFDIGQTDPDPYVAVGTSSNESIVESKAGLYFHHASGFYNYNIYGNVQEISRPIIDIIRAIPSSAYTSIAGWLEADGDHVCWSIGSVTYGGVTYNNVVVRYTISTQTWTHRIYATQMMVALRRQPLYIDGSTQMTVVGDSAGNVYEWNTGLTDDGTVIQYSLIHRWDMIDGLLTTRKNVMMGMFSHYGGAGTNVEYQTEKNDPDLLNDWSRPTDSGQLDTVNTIFNSMNIKARKMRFRLSGQSKGEQFTYNGYELIGVTNEISQVNEQINQ